MKYSGGLVKKEREQIFKLFAENTKLKFNEIEKAIKIRSNMVSYHLEKMQEEGLLEKKDDYYYLTKKAERYLPIIPHITGQELSPLPVVLVAVLHKDKILLIKRSKRPYQNYWCLIGGKMKMEETFGATAKRVVKEKAGIDAKYDRMASVLYERVEGEDIIKHSFIHFFVLMQAENAEFKQSESGTLKWFNIKDLDKEKIIPSDIWLIKNKLNSSIEVIDSEMKENKGKLSEFRVLKQ
ncbi:NUDIX domain-containing protein [Candidatus Woesearchaeota archaeon]|nr:NUDIX domain-containing protein [Candidatus Woesearchaeota archaeon]MBW3005203.1 NUDIX domain-containing protein [Candidatus Woesearchaeota archaeon]